MSIFEFDAEKEWKLIREAERKIGYEEGKQAGREVGMAEDTFKEKMQEAGYTLLA